MKILKKTKMHCIYCGTVHEVQLISDMDTLEFKGVPVEYETIYEYCDVVDEAYETEELLSRNFMVMKDAYRRKVGLLTGTDIVAIRKKYGITQTDLSRLLGWGEKTIARYETHQVQESAYDSILRKIDEDPAWYLERLKEQRHLFSEKAYKKYYTTAVQLLSQNSNAYLEKAIRAKYAAIEEDPELCGNTPLHLPKIVEVIQFFSSSDAVKHLYKVKLMKLLWYTDALSFKRHGHSMTGLSYNALPMGAVPLCHESIIGLDGVQYQEIEFGDATGFRFSSEPRTTYDHLTDSDIEILNCIIEQFGSSTRERIVERMHEEDAYQKTIPFEPIFYSLTKTLSID